MTYGAYVSGLPKIQTRGRAYLIRIRITNNGATVRPFYIDFTDDNNSWLIEMQPGLSSFNSDAWCVGTLVRGARKTLIPGKAGVHKMSVTLGKASVFKNDPSDRDRRRQRALLGVPVRARRLTRSLVRHRTS